MRYEKHFATDHCNNSCICRSNINCSYLSALWAFEQLLSVSTLWHLSNYFLTIIRDHAWWLPTGHRKQKKMPDFWPETWSQPLKKFEQWSITREFLKQYLTEKQNGYLESGRLREVVAMRELTV